MEVEITELPATAVAYLRYKGPFGQQIAEFWSEVFNPWRAAHGLDGRTTFGVAQDDPSTTAPDQCRYDACVEIGPQDQVREPGKVGALPGGRYAVAKFQGTGAQIPGAWQEFFNVWLPASGQQMDARPCFERYAADYSMDKVSGVFAAELCIPVK